MGWWAAKAAPPDPAGSPTSFPHPPGRTLPRTSLCLPLAAAEARRTFATPPKASLAALNKEGLTVAVNPGTSFVTVDAVKGVVIRRGNQIVKPLTSKITPTTVENQMGAKKQSATGRFTFPLDVFAPTGPLTIIIVGQLHNFEIPMSEVELGLLR